MLNKIQQSKCLKIIYILGVVIIIGLIGAPLFQILLEIVLNAGRIVGTFIRTYCNFL